MLNIEHFNMMLISKVATFVVNRGVSHLEFMNLWEEYIIMSSHHINEC